MIGNIFTKETIATTIAVSLTGYLLGGPVVAALSAAAIGGISSRRNHAELLLFPEPERHDQGP